MTKQLIAIDWILQSCDMMNRLSIDCDTSNESSLPLVIEHIETYIVYVLLESETSQVILAVPSIQTRTDFQIHHLDTLNGIPLEVDSPMELNLHSVVL